MPFGQLLDKGCGHRPALSAEDRTRPRVFCWVAEFAVPPESFTHCVEPVVRWERTGSGRASAVRPEVPRMP